MPARRPTREQASRALAGAALGFALPCLVAPRLVGRMARIAPEAATLIGVRDVGSGAALALAAGSPAPLVARAVFDLGDALLLARRRRSLALLAVAGLAADVAILALPLRR